MLPASPGLTVQVCGRVMRAKFSLAAACAIPACLVQFIVRHAR